RRWTMIGWLFLTFGLTLGMLWAYEELGWGGFWGWDPVENAGLLPWFTATAFLHSVMVQERRGMLRVWNVTLVITTFFLTIFGTFMTRSGVVQSVHAFGDDPALARMFTVFMLPIGLLLLVLTGVGPLLAWRKSTLINLRDSFLIPVVVGLAVGGAVAAMGVRVWTSGICFALCGFVTGTIGQEFWRGARVRQG